MPPKGSKKGLDKNGAHLNQSSANKKEITVIPDITK